MRSKHASSIRIPKHRRNKKSTPQAIEWLEDISGKAARTTVIGSRKLLVENHTGILSFSQERVLLSTGCGDLMIDGAGLYLQDVRPQALIIHGEIHRVELPCEGNFAPAGGESHAR